MPKASATTAIPIEDIEILPSVWKYLAAAKIVVDEPAIQALKKSALTEIRRIPTGHTDRLLTLKIGVRNQEVFLSTYENKRRFSSTRIPFYALRDALPVFRASATTPSKVLKKTLEQLRATLTNKQALPNVQLSLVLELVSEIFPYGPERVDFTRSQGGLFPGYNPPKTGGVPVI